MTDIRSEKWLWIKGGLFVVISLLALALLLLELSNTRQVVLVFVSIWACCRAYYFAFYVIEKYIDSRFRFAGLLYLPQYMWQRQHGLIPTEATQPSESTPLSWYVFWPCVFVVGNFIEPSFYASICRASLVQNADFLAFFIAGMFSTQIAFVAIVSSSLRVPLKIALPCSIGFFWFLAAIFFLGCAVAEAHFSQEDAVIAFLFSPMIYMSAIGLLSFTFRLLGRQWNGDWQKRSEAIIRKKQLSIRYLLAATTVVALLCVTINVSGISPALMTQGELPEIAIAIFFGSLPLICLFLLLLLATIAASSFKRGWTLYAASAILILTMPFIMNGLIWGAFLCIGKSFPAMTMYEVYHAYYFVGGFTASTLVILLHARKQGLRLVSPV